MKKKYVPKDNDDVFKMNIIKTDSNIQRIRPISEKKTSYERIFNPSKLSEKNFDKNFQNRNNHFNKYKKAYTDSVTDIFQSKTYASSKEYNISNKPNNSDFNSLSNAAKKNLSERYFYDNNYSQF